MSAYKLIQLGFTAYGNGDTAEQAREDAREWLDSPEQADDAPVVTNSDAVRANHVQGDLIIVPADVAADLGDY